MPVRLKMKHQVFRRGQVRPGQIQENGVGRVDVRCRPPGFPLIPVLEADIRVLEDIHRRQLESAGVMLTTNFACTGLKMLAVKSVLARTSPYPQRAETGMSVAMTVFSSYIG